MIKKEVGIIFDDLTEFYVMQPALEGLKKNNIKFDIIVSKEKSYSNLAEHTFNAIKSFGYDIKFKNFQNIIYKVLLTPYPKTPIEEEINFIYTIKYPYGSLCTKPNPVQTVDWNIPYDAILTFNTIEKYDGYGVRTIPMPYWPSINNKKIDYPKKINGKKDLLILATFGDVCCIDMLNDEVINEIKNKYRIIAKAHHRVDFHEDERKRLNKLKRISDVYFSSDTPVNSLLKKVDVALSDGSAAIFDSICSECPIAIFIDNPNKRHLEKLNTYQYKLIKEGIIPFTNRSDKLLSTIDKALEHKIISRQKNIKKEIFLPINPNAIEIFVEVIKEYITRDENEDTQKIMHDMLKEKILSYKYEIKKLERKLSVEKQEIEKIQNSTSWKITEPLRYINAKLKN